MPKAKKAAKKARKPGRPTERLRTDLPAAEAMRRLLRPKKPRTA
jgi:hypothetical protein